MQDYNVTIMQFHSCDVLLINSFSDVILLVYEQEIHSLGRALLFLEVICESSRTKEKQAFLWNKTGIFLINNSDYEIYFDIYPLKNKQQGYSNNLVYGGHIFTLYQLSQLQSFILSQQRICTDISEFAKQKQAQQNQAAAWKCISF